MKIKLVKVNPAQKKRKAAFTLIEMIGVLAVIAILAALLIPKVFNAINSARINNAAESIATIKTAVTDHYGKYGALNTVTTNGVTTTLTPTAIGYDTNVLMAEGLLDKPFAIKIGTNAIVQLVAGGSENAGVGYQLAGTAATSTTNESYIVEVEIQGVAQQDAIDLNTIIDGSTLASAAPALADTKGRVEYTAPSANTTVYVYLTGR